MRAQRKSVWKAKTKTCTRLGVRPEASQRSEAACRASPDKWENRNLELTLPKAKALSISIKKVQISGAAVRDRRASRRAVSLVDL